MHRRAAFLSAFGLAAAFLAGCGAPTATVSGGVTMDGQPLDNGVISYASADGSGNSATAEVRNGKYSLRTTPGEKWVQISAPVVVGRRKAYDGPDAPMEDIRAERLPERYNAKTELKYTLKAGDNTKDWAVEGKPRQAGGR